MSFQETLTKLREHLPADVIKSRITHGNFSSDYIEWHTAANILDDVCPEWSHEIKDVGLNDNFCYCRVAITIEGVTREGIGVQAWTNDAEKDLKSAEHDALKRAAVKFGVARELYYKGNAAATPQNQQPETQLNAPANKYGPPVRPESGKARDLSSQITPKQLGLLKAKARELGHDVDAIATKAFPDVATAADLSKLACSWLISAVNTRLQEGANA